MATPYADILKKMQDKQFAPLYWFEGEEPFFMDILARYIENHALEPEARNFNQWMVYGKDTSIPEVLDAASQYPLEATHRVVIVKEAQELSDIGKKKAQERLLAYAQHAVASTILVFCYKYHRLDARTSLAKAIAANAVYFESKKLYDNRLPEWLAQRAQDKGFRMAPKASFMLIENTGNDLYRLAQEMDKLILNLGEEKCIEDVHVQRYVGISKDFNAFELQHALGEKNLAKALKICSYLLSNTKTHSAFRMISLFFGYFTKLLQLHLASHRLPDRQLAGQLGIHPYFLRQYREATRVYTLDAVLSALQVLCDADLKAKGVEHPYASEAALLESLICKLMH